MTQKEENRYFLQIESRSHTIEKPRPFAGTPAPLLEWLARIIRRMGKTSKITPQE